MKNNNMNFHEIKKILETENHREVCKAIFSFETGIQDELFLDDLVQFYLDDDMPNFLDVNIHDKVMKYLKINHLAMEINQQIEDMKK
ncbi:hypothetical protein P3T97_14015 (plasmid) [Mammaliicoccus sciuri]|uniref:hypothetical protein n=1 Tax=Mammaliicoccus sciuri TaxID=1296 RepID=UPI002B259B84|nr:hypothetical protein [Mammaliicoccus sciuri]WQJ67281.1 hypothetical protein P3T97_14015 [Mammaliicoccus sciuri]